MTIRISLSSDDLLVLLKGGVLARTERGAGGQELVELILNDIGFPVIRELLREAEWGPPSTDPADIDKPFSSMEEVRGNRPSTFTQKRAWEVMPKFEPNPEFSNRSDEPPLIVSPTESKMSIAEAVWVMRFEASCLMTWRGMAEEMTGDSNQIHAAQLLSEARKVVKDHS